MPIRYDTIKQERIESPVAVESFLDAYAHLCRQHGLCLSHEDGHGAFIVERYSKHCVNWVRSAILGVLRGAQLTPHNKE